MTGEELFTYYTSKRDYSGSEADEYAQLLLTLYLQEKESLYSLLEKAENQNKRLSVKDSTDVFSDEELTIIFE